MSYRVGKNDSIGLDSPYTATLSIKPSPMRTIVRYTIAIIISAIIPVVALTHFAKTATAGPQTQPDYRLPF
jgi:hypothetical protein